MVKATKEKLEFTIRNFLRFYTIGIFVVLLALIGIVFIGNVQKVNSQSLQSCSGNFGSGQSCNGNPGDGRTWSCLPDTNSPTDFSCQSVPISQCYYYYPCDSGSCISYNCGCEGPYQQCVQECQTTYAGQPGTHAYYNPNIRCDNCGQIVGCACTIPGQQDQCPYNEAVIRFQPNSNVAWTPTLNPICGESFNIGALHTQNGQLLGSDAVIFINGQPNNTNLIQNYVLTEQNPTALIALRVKMSSNQSNYYPEDQCRADVSVTCTPAQDSCPYNNVNIEFSKNGQNWSTNPQITCGETLYARTTADGAVGGSRVKFYKDNVLQSANQIQFQTAATNGNATTYRFRTEVLNNDGEPYTEPQCKSARAITCQPADVPNECDSDCTDKCDGGLTCHNGKCRDPRWPEEPSCTMNYEIDKEVESGNNSDIYSEVVFRVTMTNNSTNTIYTSVPFRDRYNPSQLIFRNPVFGERKSATGTTLQAINFNMQGSAGNLSHPNLASVLGNLNPRERYVLHIKFQATSSGVGICNEADWNPNDYGTMDDSACLGIQVPRPPDTDL